MNDLHLRRVFGRYRHLAPMSVRETILAEVARWPEGALRDAWSERAARLQPLDVSPARGQAVFPLVRRDGLVEGHLATVTTRSGGLGGEDHVALTAAAARARAWLTQFMSLITHGDDAIHGRRVSDLRLDLTLFRPEEGGAREARDNALELQGRSLELACLVALASELMGLAPRRAVVLSGAACDSDASLVEAVGCWDEKARICALEAPEAAVMLAREASPLGPILQAVFGDDALERLTRAGAESAHALLARARSAWSHRDHAQAAALARLALARAEGALDRVAARVYLGAEQLHRGNLEGACALLDEAVYIGEAAERQGETRHLPLLTAARIFSAVTALDQLLPGRAMAALESLREASCATPSRFRNDTWYQQHMSCLGTMERAARGLGDLPRAETLRAEALVLGEASQRARNLLELARLAHARGDLPLARARLSDAEAALSDNGFPVDRARTERFLNIARRQLGLTPPPDAATVAAAASTPPRVSDWPQPAELAETLLAAPDLTPLLAWLSGPGLDGLTRHPATAQYAIVCCARAVTRGGPLASDFRSLAADFAARLPDATEAVLLGPIRTFLAGGDPAPVIRQALY